MRFLFCAWMLFFLSCSVPSDRTVSFFDPGHKVLLLEAGSLPITVVWEICKQNRDIDSDKYLTEDTKRILIRELEKNLKCPMPVWLYEEYFVGLDGPAGVWLCTGLFLPAENFLPTEVVPKTPEEIEDLRLYWGVE